MTDRLALCGVGVVVLAMAWACRRALIGAIIEFKAGLKEIEDWFG